MKRRVAVAAALLMIAALVAGYRLHAIWVQPLTLSEDDTVLSVPEDRAFGQCLKELRQRDGSMTRGGWAG